MLIDYVQHFANNLITNFNNNAFVNTLVAAPFFIVFSLVSIKKR